jgi:hypothetical protein
VVVKCVDVVFTITVLVWTAVVLIVVWLVTGTSVQLVAVT